MILHFGRSSEALIANAKQKDLSLKTAKMADIVGVLKAEIQAIRHNLAIAAHPFSIR